MIIPMANSEYVNTWENNEIAYVSAAQGGIDKCYVHICMCILHENHVLSLQMNLEIFKYIR